MKMEYTAEVLRGWPGEGALERAETIKTGVTLVNGDVVEKQSDGTVDKVSTTERGYLGLVVRGNGDAQSSVNSNKALVLWGNFIVRVKAAQVVGTVVPGTAIAGGGTAAAGKFKQATGTDIAGYCLFVQAATATEDAHYVIMVR
jgi:hypothetical protein